MTPARSMSLISLSFLFLFSLISIFTQAESGSPALSEIFSHISPASKCSSRKTFSKFLSVVRSRVKNTKCWIWSRVFPDTTSCVTATTLSLTLTLCPNPKPYTELRCLRRSAFRPLRGRSARFAVGHHFLVYPLCF